MTVSPQAFQLTALSQPSVKGSNLRRLPGGRCSTTELTENEPFFQLGCRGLQAPDRVHLRNNPPGTCLSAPR